MTSQATLNSIPERTAHHNCGFIFFFYFHVCRTNGIGSKIRSWANKGTLQPRGKIFEWNLLGRLVPPLCWQLVTAKRAISFFGLSKTILKIDKFWKISSFMIGFCSDRFETVCDSRKTLHVYLFCKFKPFFFSLIRSGIKTCGKAKIKQKKTTTKNWKSFEYSYLCGSSPPPVEMRGVKSHNGLFPFCLRGRRNRIFVAILHFNAVFFLFALFLFKCILTRPYLFFLLQFISR